MDWKHPSLFTSEEFDNKHAHRSKSKVKEKDFNALIVPVQAKNGPIFNEKSFDRKSTPAQRNPPVIKTSHLTLTLGLYYVKQLLIFQINQA